MVLHKAKWTDNKLLELRQGCNMPDFIGRKRFFEFGRSYLTKKEVESLVILLQRKLK